MPRWGRRKDKRAGHSVSEAPHTERVAVKTRLDALDVQIDAECAVLGKNDHHLAAEVLSARWIGLAAMRAEKASLQKKEVLMMEEKPGESSRALWGSQPFLRLCSVSGSTSPLTRAVTSARKRCHPEQESVDEHESPKEPKRIRKDCTSDDYVKALRTFEPGVLDERSIVVIPPTATKGNEKAIFLRRDFVRVIKAWRASGTTKRHEIFHVNGNRGVGKSELGRLIFALHMAEGETVLLVNDKTMTLYHGANVNTIASVTDLKALGIATADVSLVYDSTLNLEQVFGVPHQNFKRALVISMTPLPLDKEHVIKVKLNGFILPEVLDLWDKFKDHFHPSATTAAAELGATRRIVEGKYRVSRGSLEAMLKQNSVS